MNTLAHIVLISLAALISTRPSPQYRPGWAILLREDR